MEGVTLKGLFGSMEEWKNILMEWKRGKRF